MPLTQITSGGIQDGTITNDDISASATIDATKITGLDKISEGNTEAEVVDTGSNGHFKVTTEGTERLRVDSSGRCGIGTSSPGAKLDVWPASSDAAFRGNSGVSTQVPAFEFRGYNSNATNGGLDIRTNLNGAFADRVRITNDGLVGIGTTSPSVKLDVNGDIFASGGDIYTGANRMLSSDSTIRPLIFGIGAGEKARIDSSGRLLVGTSSFSDGATLVLQGNSTNSNWDAVLRLLRNISNPAAGETLGSIIYGVGSAQGAQIQGVTDAQWGTNDYPTRLVFSTTADGASSPTERMRIVNDGAVRIKMGNYADPTVANNTVNGGFIIGATSGTPVQFATSGDASLNINRLTNDGDLLQFNQAGTNEGSISVSGTTVSYNGAHLSRWSQLPSGAERTKILRGSVLSNIDEMCEWGDEENEQLNRMKVSDVEGDKNVSGVFQGWDDDDDTYTNDFYCAMTGDFIIRIGAGVTVERGDLLMSAGDGTAKPQDDDIIRSKTIAKVTSTNVSCTYDDGSYCVPCVLMAC